ncbi:MFS general substrate transporter [Mycena kentingensis (nom. inval.)]|nr:MFS general substrate transporter [Mycena kentingensis (nom. inval.)]
MTSSPLPNNNSELSGPAQRDLDFGFLPIPPWCRPRRAETGELEPPPFGYAKVLAFGVVSTFIANLYYNQPILLELAKAFNVDEEGVSRIPTLLQAGYASGLLLLSPLGDLIKRRPMLLLLITISGSLTIGLAVTHSLVVFEVLSFLIAFSSVTPQVLIPLAADLAPANRRATFMSIVFSGLLMGVLLARVLAGLIAQLSAGGYRTVFILGAAA